MPCRLITLVLGLRAVVTACLIFLPALPSAAGESPTRVGADSDVSGQLQTLIERYDIPGGAIAIVKDGRLLLAAASGSADVDEHQPVVAEKSLFRIASISKSITAACILNLVEQGKLRLDDKAFSLLKLHNQPADSRINEITVSELLNMTAGWDKERSGDPILQPYIRKAARHFGERGPADFDTSLDYVLGKPLDFAPGTRFAYSNFAYGVLGKIVEEVSGTSYETYARGNIFQPAAIELTAGRTAIDQRQPNEVIYYAPHEHRARRLLPGQGPLVPRPYGRVYLEADLPMVGWLATAPQLAMLFDQLCGDHGIIGVAMKQQLFDPPARSCWQSAGKYFCDGFEVTALEDGRLILYKDGTLPGTRAFLKRTADGITCVALFNGRPSASAKLDKFALDTNHLLDRLCREVVEPFKPVEPGQGQS